MALALYKVEESGIESEVDNVTNKVTAFHDTADGSYTHSMFYLTNSPSSYGYENIEVSIFIDGQANGPIGNNGIVYYLLPIAGPEYTPAIASWENLPYNNTIAFPAIPAGVETKHYFILRTYAPKGKGANYISEASINVSAVEVI